ncbi:Eco57I restriction-modification methylase domain-containing protein [Pedobacter jeongneungensis]|uniref:Eco57I restriction-modification methylase domain-containing protein n=1 Tax=Pedobacter jeongneungensis TaxID=947309 RepID=UPI00046AB96C|nr:helicase-related protein [Pedobacter jeongneungensis]
MAFNKNLVIQDNLAAISLAFDIHRNTPRKETISEQIKILNRYRGFGGIKEVLLSDDPTQWSKSSLNLFEHKKKLDQLCVQMDSFNKVQAGTFYDSIRNSVLSAFFTPESITNIIAETVIANFKPKLILEPSAGSGAFIDSILETEGSAISNKQIYAVEKDQLTASILKAKYIIKGLYKPGANGTTPVNLFTGGFEKHANSMEFFKNRFDLSMSNIPFGDAKVFDEKYLKDKRPIVKQSTNRIHNYFFVKNLDMLKDKGFLAFIVTASFLNSPGNESIRKFMLSKADIVSVTRFPNKLFNEHAGTEVSSDLIVLQKNDKKLNLSNEDLLLASTENDTRYGNVNSYFNFYQENNNYIADEVKLGTDLYGKAAALLEFSGTVEQIADLLGAKLNYDFTKFKAKSQHISLDLFAQAQDNPNPVKKATAGLQFDLFNPILELGNSRDAVFSGQIKPWYSDGVLILQDGKPGHLKKDDLFEGKTTFSPLDTKINPDHAKAYIELRDAFNELYDFEKQKQIENPELRDKAAGLYQFYFENYGRLNDRRSKALINYDQLSSQSYAMEKRSVNENKEFIYVPADLFSHPVAFSSSTFKTISPLDALFLSVNSLNKVDLDFIKLHSGVNDSDQLLKQLKGFIYYDFKKSEFQYKDAFLSGNINEKLNYYQSNFPRISLNDISTPEGEGYSELLKVLPKKIQFEELDFNLGERWLDKKYYEEFASKLFEEDIKVVYLKGSDTFKAEKKYGGSNSIIDEAYAVRTESGKFDGLQLLEYGLVSNSPYLTRIVGYNLDGNPVRAADHEGMRKVALKIEEITNRFGEFMAALSNQEKDHIAGNYNAKFNCFSTHRSNGEHLQFKGLENFIPNQHQKDAAWKLVLNGGGICDHPVGAGKSLIMALQTQKMREIGFAKKPMIACLKANAADVAKDYIKAFPDAKVLFPGDADFTKAKRLSFLNMIKNNDWDCVIVTHEQFGMIPQPKDIQEALLSRELKQVQEDIELVKQEGGEVSKAMLKGLVKREANLIVKLETVIASLKKDTDIPDFRDLGIDHLAVDESHEFKNLAFTTRHGRVAGLGNTFGSQRSFNMLVAARTLQAHHGADKGISFYSGTTISNSLTELYNIFKYIAPETLEKQNIYNFDSWASVFTKKSTEYEVSVTNQLIMKERFRTFIKVPELCSLYSKITHFISQKDLKIERPDNVVKLVNIPLTKDQEQFSQNLIEFAQNGDATLIHRHELTEGEKTAKMLIATNTARNMAVDMRLVAPFYSDDPGSKLSVAAKNISDWYQKSDFCKGTQLVFCDLGTPGKSDRFNVYAELKRKLVEDYNIPANEIAFVHDAKTDRARQAMFQKVRSGELRVFFGSTKKMGTGTNVQTKVVAMHDLNVPWTPKDLEQRHGRGPRQGNEVAKLHFDNKVHTYVYAVDRSLDAYGFNLLRNKQLFIDQVKNNTLSVRTVDEGALDESSGLPFKEYVAVLSGNTDLLEKLKLDKKIAGLEAEKKSFTAGQIDLEWKLKQMKEHVLKTEKVFKSLNEDSKTYSAQLKIDSKTGAKMNPISIQGRQFAKSDEAGLAILDIYKQAKSNGLVLPTKIGELYGFDLYIKKNNMGNDYEMFGKRNFVEYTYSNGLPNENLALAARYFLNAIEKCNGLAQNYKAKLANEYKDINLLENQKGRTWDKIDTLRKLKADANMLENRIINSINKTSETNGSILKDQKQQNEQSKEIVNINFDKVNKQNMKIN